MDVVVDYFEHELKIETQGCFKAIWHDFSYEKRPENTFEIDAMTIAGFLNETSSYFNDSPSNKYELKHFEEIALPYQVTAEQKAQGYVYEPTKGIWEGKELVKTERQGLRLHYNGTEKGFEDFIVGINNAGYGTPDIIHPFNPEAEGPTEESLDDFFRAYEIIEPHMPELVEREVSRKDTGDVINIKTVVTWE